MLVITGKNTWNNSHEITEKQNTLVNKKINEKKEKTLEKTIVILEYYDNNTIVLLLKLIVSRLPSENNGKESKQTNKQLLKLEAQLLVVGLTVLWLYVGAIV